MLEFYKRSKKGAKLGISPEGLVTLCTDHEKGNAGCKAMGNYALMYDDYLKNTYYYQIKIEDNYDPGNA